MQQSLRIGKLAVSPPVLMAPMSGVTSLPFRLLCRRAGAGLVYTEQLSANALIYGSAKTRRMMTFLEAERPLCMQLLGADPVVMARATEIVVAAGADLVDLNMGCSVPKVVKAGAGAALLRDRDRAAAIIRAMTAESPVPVTAKIRAGFEEGSDYVALAQALEDAGACAITVHGRTAQQRLRGPAALGPIERVKRAVSVPVIGNGGVVDGQSARRMLHATGCDAVMVARGALGRPQVFAEINAALFGARPPPANRIEERAALLLCQAQMLAVLKGERTAVREMRQHAAWYSRGLPHSASLRRRLNQVTRLAELADRLVEYARGGSPGATPAARAPAAGSP